MSTAPVQKFHAGDVYVTNNLCIILECKSCDQQFGVYTKFLDHIFGKHFEDWNALEKHKTVNNENTYTNEVDQYPSNNEEYLDIETTDHSDVDDLITDILEPMEDGTSDAIIEEEPQPKSVAKVSYKNVRAVRRFEKNSTKNVKEKKFKCKICGFLVADIHNLRGHELRHGTIKPFTCLQCNKAFYTSTELNIHIRRHNNEKPHVCTYCGKAFVTTSSLTAHEKRHTGDRRHKCDQCDKSFYILGQLRNHYVVHTKERNYSCEVCHAKFSRQNTLRTHMKLHENALRYECTICHMRFNQKPTLLWHIKSKHNVINKEIPSKGLEVASKTITSEY